MNILIMKRTRLVASLAATLIGLGSLAGVANAAIVISNWNVVDNTTVSFDISGTIDSGVSIGSSDPDAFYIGAPGNADWITMDSSAGSSPSKNIQNHGGGSTNISTDHGSYLTYAPGDYIVLRKEGLVAWEVGDSVDASISISGGTLDGSQIDPADIIVTAGYFSGSPWPDASAQVGEYSAVPEPSSAVLCALGVAFAASRKRKLNKPLE